MNTLIIDTTYSSCSIAIVTADMKSNTTFNNSNSQQSETITEVLLTNLIKAKKELKEIIHIKVRSTGRLLKAKIDLQETTANVEILDKETGISPGQACVFYSKDKIGDKVLGGGWIHKTHNKNLST